MSIDVLFFASLREQLGQAKARTEWQEGLTVEQLWQQVNAGQALPDNVLVARNQHYCERSTVVHDGDEVAFFPPVTGG